MIETIVDSSEEFWFKQLTKHRKKE